MTGKLFKGEMQQKVRIILMLMTAALMACACGSAPECTHIAGVGGDVMLVRHSPKDPGERMRMMLSCYDSAGISLGEMKRRGGALFYSMAFVKDTEETRKHYQGKDTGNWDGHGTGIGAIEAGCMDGSGRCMTASNGGTWQVRLLLGPDGGDGACDGRPDRVCRYMIYDESDPDWWEHHRDSTISEYNRRTDCYEDGRVIGWFRSLQKDRTEADTLRISPEQAMKVIEEALKWRSIMHR